MIATSRSKLAPAVSAMAHATIRSLNDMADQMPGGAAHLHDDLSISFPAFVLSLAHTAAVHFGDIPDPVTGEAGEANLGAARQMIDILALLEEKTRGNLSAEER